MHVCAVTSKEGVLEGECVEDAEAVGGADGEAALVLVEADEEDLLSLVLADGLGHERGGLHDR